MLKFFLLSALVFTSLSATAGDLYRCERNGTVLYTDRACGDGRAPVANLPDALTPTPPPNRDVPETDNSTNVNVEVNNNIDLPSGGAAVPVAPVPPRGLQFRDFRRLERGLSEAEVLAIAGPPENEVIDGVNSDLGLTTKSYYYVSKGYNANITRIQFTNGNVTDLERTLRPF